MKKDNNQYYYSPSTNYPWHTENNKPNDAIPLTAEMESKIEIGIRNGYVITPNNENFEMVHPDQLLTPEELTRRKRENDVTNAKQLLSKTHHFETDTYKNLLFESEEYLIFENWRRELLGVIIDDNELPETPKFITDLMEQHT